MENISFVLWLVLFPLSLEIGSYYSILRYKLDNKEYVINKETISYLAIAYVVIAILLYN